MTLLLFLWYHLHWYVENLNLNSSKGRVYVCVICLYPHVGPCPLMKYCAVFSCHPEEVKAFKHSEIQLTQSAALPVSSPDFGCSPTLHLYYFPLFQQNKHYFTSGILIKHRPFGFRLLHQIFWWTCFNQNTIRDFWCNKAGLLLLVSVYFKAFEFSRDVQNFYIVKVLKVVWGLILWATFLDSVN